MSDELLDARGVPIGPGDTVIYGFGVGRSVAMAEGVVLKEVDGPLQPGTPEPCFALPSSPLPTQDAQARIKIERSIASYTADLGLTNPPDWWRNGRGGTDLAGFHAFTARQLALYRGKLRALDG